MTLSGIMSGFHLKKEPLTVYASGIPNKTFHPKAPKPSSPRRPSAASFFIHSGIVSHYLEGGYYPVGGPQRPQ